MGFTRNSLFVAFVVLLCWAGAAHAAVADKPSWPLRCEARFEIEGKQPLVLKRNLNSDGSFSYQHGHSRAVKQLSISFWLWGGRTAPPDVSFHFKMYSVNNIADDDVLRFLTADGSVINTFTSPDILYGSWLLRREEMMQWLPTDGQVTVELRRTTVNGEPGRVRHSGTFDAAHLRKELAALPDLHDELNAKQEQWSKRCLDGKDIIDDPNADILCPTQFRDDDTYYYSTSGNMQAQVRIGQSLSMTISRVFFEDAPAQDFVARGLEAFTSQKWFVHATLSNRRDDSSKRKYRVAITNGGDRIEAQGIGDRVDYKILRNWDKRITETVFTLYAEDGEIVEQTQLAPGKLKRIENGLRGTVAEALQKRENPVKNCDYPDEIIIT